MNANINIRKGICIHIYICKYDRSKYFGIFLNTPNMSAYFQRFQISGDVSKQFEICFLIERVIYIYIYVYHNVLQHEYDTPRSYPQMRGVYIYMYLQIYIPNIFVYLYMSCIWWYLPVHVQMCLYVSLYVFLYVCILLLMWSMLYICAYKACNVLYDSL